MKYRYFTIKQLLCSAFIVGGLFSIGAGVPSMVRADAMRWEATLPTLRIQIDAPRYRAWVLNNDAVYLYDVPTGRLIKRIDLPDWSFVSEMYSCAPDLALAPSGAALVTSNVTPIIWEIHPESMAVRQHKLSPDADNDKDVGFTGLAFGQGGRDLFGVSSLLGSAWRIDLAAGKARKLRLSEPIRGACGLTVLLGETPRSGDGAPVLCVAGAKTSRRVELTPDMRAGRTSAAPCY